MTEGFYTNPSSPDVRGKVCCVIPSFISANRLREYPDWKEDKLDTLKRTLAAHKHFKPGIAYDVVLIDNGSVNEEGRVFLKKNGALRRKNSGFSFGGWKHAWDKLKDKYSFFLFTEDDIAPTQNNWLAKILLKFMSQKDIGAVGSFVEGRSKREAMSDVMWEILKHGDREMMYNLDGAFTFTSSDILRQVDEMGGLTVFPVRPESDYSPTVNELAFVSRILELGYKIASFDDGKHTLVHGSEVFTGNLFRQYKELCPLININARRTVPQVAKAFEWYED